jgi:hypothetical protein
MQQKKSIHSFLEALIAIKNKQQARRHAISYGEGVQHRGKGQGTAADIARETPRLRREPCVTGTKVPRRLYRCVRPPLYTLIPVPHIVLENKFDCPGGAAGP